MSSYYSLWQAMLGQFLGQLPSLTVWIAAMILAVLRRHRHPQVSNLVLIAGALILLNNLGGTYIGARIPLMMRQQGMTMQQFGFIMGIVTLVRSLLAGLTAGLLVWAIFGWRSGGAGGNPQPPNRTPTGSY